MPDGPKTLKELEAALDREIALAAETLSLMPDHERIKYSILNSTRGFIVGGVYVTVQTKIIAQPNNSHAHWFGQITDMPTLAEQLIPVPPPLKP